MEAMIRLVAIDCIIIFFPAVIGTLFGALFLLAAIALYNRMAGGAGAPGSVPAPRFVKALGISFAASLSNAVIGSAVAAVTQATPAVDVLPVGWFGTLAQVVALPLSLLVMAATLKALLPTSFGRALVVTLLFLVIAMVIAIILTMPIVLTMLIALTGTRTGAFGHV